MLPQADFVLITALEEERDALLAKLPGHRQLDPCDEDIRVYYHADLTTVFPSGAQGSYKVIVMPLLGMGRVQATAATGDAIRRWHPRYVILVGIAGGIAAKGINLGDVLISDQIVDYELQKITDEVPEIRWEVYRTDPRLYGKVLNFKKEAWHSSVTEKRPEEGFPIRHTGSIASGDKVVAFSKILSRYGKQWPKLIGTEMEAGGVSVASFQSTDSAKFFMVRCVSDFADNQKDSSEVKKWRCYACDVAAAYTIALLKSGPIELSPNIKQDDSYENVNDSAQSDDLIIKNLSRSPFIRDIENTLRSEKTYWEIYAFQSPLQGKSFTTTYLPQLANIVLQFSVDLDSINFDLRLFRQNKMYSLLGEIEKIKKVKGIFANSSMHRLRTSIIQETELVYSEARNAKREFSDAKFKLKIGKDIDAHTENLERLMTSISLSLKTLQKLFKELSGEAVLFSNLSTVTSDTEKDFTDPD